MKLNNILSGLGSKTEEKQENFLALEINYETVKAAVWTVKDGNVKILKLGSIEEWEAKDGKESLLKASDATISTVLEGIKEEPTKIIFGLPFNWVETESIKSEKKPLLANICEKLALQPVGFVVSQEALITYLKNQQGTPLSAILVQLMTSEITVSLVSLGKIVQSENVGRSEDLALDIKEGLARVKSIDSLPSRIILFDGLTDFEEAKQQIISYDWQSQLPFLHFPKVESLKRDFVMEAIAIAGGSEVAKSLGFDIQEKTEQPEPEVISAEEEVSAIPQDIQNFGFVKDEDIAQVTDKLLHEPLKNEIKIPYPEEKIQKPKQSFPSQVSRFFKCFPNPLKKLPIGGKVLLPLVFLLILIFGVFAGWWFIAKAEVSIYFQPKKIEKNVIFTLDQNISQPDWQNKIIPVQTNEIKIDGEKQAQTTGEKLVGDKASGEITIYNKIDLSKTFAKGTVLIRSDNLKFVTVDSVTIASASSKTTSEGEEITWGKSTVGVEADKVGKDSNTESGVSFSLKDYPASNFSAKTEEGLSGGTSETVKVVTAKDREDLVQELTDELIKEGEKRLLEQNTTEKIIVENTAKTEVVDETFDKKVGEEADSVDLKLTLSLQSFSFKKQDLNEFLKQELASSLPSGLVFNDNDFTTQVVSSKSVDEKIKVEMAVTMNLLPGIDPNTFKKDLKGKTNKGIERYLSNNEDFVKAKVEIYPSVFSILKRLPPNENNIQVKIELL